MLPKTKIIASTLSFRLSLRVIAALAVLLMVALLIMFYYSRKAVREEARQKAEQTLEMTVQRIDNILLDIEQATGNVYWKVTAHINEPDMLRKYVRMLVEENEHITACTVALEPGFYDGAKQDFYAFYVRKDSTHVVARKLPSKKPYHKQSWYVHTMETGLPSWTDALTVSTPGFEPIISFCLPLYQGERKVGVLATDVALSLLSKIVQEVKATPNSFSTLLGKDGSVIVFPDSTVLSMDAIPLAKEEHNVLLEETVQAMVAGETGHKPVNLEGVDYYAFYKPFVCAPVLGRSPMDLGWSVCVALPEDDILSSDRQLNYTVLLIAVIGLLLMLLLCRWFIHHQLLPLRMLSRSAQRIAEGHYDESIPISPHQDEVGRLQNHFKQMQQSLAIRMEEMNHLSETLQERGEVLQATYKQAQAASNMKTNFLYNMSNQMVSPVKTIFDDVMMLSSNYDVMTDEEATQLTDEVELNGNRITAMLNQLIVDSQIDKAIEQ